MTLPAPACSNIDWEGTLNGDFSDQLQAFRSLGTHGLFKLSLHFKERFWENPNIIDPKYCVIGGQLGTDLSSRGVIYPSYGFRKGDPDQGTILIYNWGNDAVRWTGMSEQDRVYRAITDL